MKSRYCSAYFEGFGLKSLDKAQVTLFYGRRLALTATGKSQHALNNSVHFPGPEFVPDNAGIYKHPVCLYGGPLCNSADEISEGPATGNAERAHLFFSDCGSVFLARERGLVELQNKYVHLGDGGQHCHLPNHISE